VSDTIFGTYLIPFEAISLLLLAAAIGAIVISAGTEGRPMLLNQFLILAAALFCIGVYGVIARRNAVLVLMSVELILNAVNINLVAFSVMTGAISGQVFALFVIAVAAAEVGVGLAIVLAIFRNYRNVDLTDLDVMRG
jgi:NAD(P)H-quinone oxidoreductase subunit 4L